MFLTKRNTFFVFLEGRFNRFFVLLHLQNTIQSMNFQPQQIKSTIRFRRWSRVGYAVFCSLACSVTIGCLAVSVSDKSLQKAVGTAVVSSYEINSESDSPDKQKEPADLELAMQQFQEIVLSGKKIESAAACNLNTYLLFNQAVEMRKTHFNRFYFYSL